MKKELLVVLGLLAFSAPCFAAYEYKVVCARETSVDALTDSVNKQIAEITKTRVIENVTSPSVGNDGNTANIVQQIVCVTVVSVPKSE